MGLKPRYGHCGLHAARRAAVDANVLRFVRLEELPIHAGDVFTGRGKVVFWTLPIVDANDLDFAERRDGNRFEFSAPGPAAGKSASVKVDEYSIFVFRRNSCLWRVNVCMYASDFLILPFDGEDLPIAREIRLHETRNPCVLLDDFWILHVLQMLGNVCSCFRT